MNLVILDIAIGLVFVYLIYSLFASIMAEFISHHLGMRSRMLRRAIENLLNDFPSRRNFGDKVGAALSDYFLREKDSFKFSKAGEFYRHPGVKYLANERSHEAFKLKKNRPAYIRTETFSSTLLEMIRKFGQGISEWDQIKFSIVNNAAHFDQETAEQLRIMLHDADDDMEKFIGRIEDWFDEMMDRITGWYKRKIRGVIFLIGIIIVFGFNVDSLYIVDILSNDEKVRENMIQASMQLVEKQEAIAKLDSVITPSEKDSLSAGYDRVKRDLDIIKQEALKTNTLLGLGWGFDTMNYEKKSFNLTHSPTSAHEKISSVISIDKKVRSQKDSLKKLELRIKTLKSHYRSVSSDKSISEDNKKSNLDYLTNIIIKDSLSIDSVESDLESIYNDFNKEFRQQYSIIDSIQVDSCRVRCHCSPRVIVYGHTRFTTIDKLDHIWKIANPSKNKFWGLIITALALSLGSQFWFDTLKKLISIRNVGINSDRAKRKENLIKAKSRKKRSKRGTRLTTHDPVEIALSKYSSQWLANPGIIAANPATTESDGRYIEIVKLDGHKDPQIKSPLILSIDNIEHQIILKVVKGEYAQLQQGLQPFQGCVRNKNFEAFGTVTGLVRNERTNAISLLSCAHVLRSDTSTFMIEDKRDIEILNGTKYKKVATLTNLIFSNFLDAAIADFPNKNNLPDSIEAIKKIRKVAYADEENKTKVNIKTAQGNIEGQIVQVRFSYMAKENNTVYKHYNLIKISAKDGPGSSELTLNGQSGSLIEDDLNNAIGMVLGSIKKDKKHYTLAIPIYDVFEALNISSIN